MITRLDEKHRQFRRMFLSFWIMFTLICLGIAIYFQWEHARAKELQKFLMAATNLSFQFDQLIENTLEAVSKAPIEVHSQQNCEKLLPIMQNIVLDNFYIAGVVISDLKNKILCTTFDNHTTLPAAPLHSPVMFGPFKISTLPHKFYLVQQQFGNHYIGIYLISPLLEKLFQINQENFDFIGLYNHMDNTLIFKMGKLFNSTELLKHLPKGVLHTPIHSPKNGDAVVPVKTLDNIHILVSSDTLALNQKSLLRALVLILILLFISWLFYRLSSRVINKRFSLQYVMNDALNNHEFYPEYQAVHDESSGRFSGAEVLIRWKNSGGEKIFPDFFIPEAEKSGLIVPMTLRLMEDALSECKALFHSNPDFHLAFNISPGHFNDETFFSRFYELCRQYQINPQQLMLELTERELFNQTDEDIKTRMSELRQMGFSLALDDFGTGQANLNYLQHFPFNFIKIDKMFIHTIGTGAITENLTLSIINMAHSLNLEIIAEGVETQEQLYYLQNHKVRFIQGWIYAKALPRDGFFNLINPRET